MAEDKTIFRQKQEKQEEVTRETSYPPTDKKPDMTQADSEEMKPSEYPISMHYPYSVEVLGAKEVINTMSVREQSKAIDKYVRKEMNNANFKDDKKSYEKVVKALLKEAKVPEETEITAKLEKLTQYIRIQETLSEDIEKREKILNSNPEKMKANKLKKYLRLKGVKYV